MRSRLWTTVSLLSTLVAANACGGSSGPTATSAPQSFLAGTWIGTVTIERDGEPTTSGRVTWTFEVVPDTNRQSLRTTIRSQHAFLPVTMTPTSAITPQTLRRHASARMANTRRRGMHGSILSNGTADVTTRDADLPRIDCATLARSTFGGKVVLTKLGSWTTMPAIDRPAPLNFLRAAYQPDDWIAVFLKSYETGQISQRVDPVGRVAEQRFQSWLRWRNLLCWNVYVSVNAIAPHSRSRTHDAVAHVRHVFVEADQDGPEVLASRATRRDVAPPSYVLHSSPGRVHLFWRARGFSPDSVKALQKLLAVQLGNDRAATPCTQTTRRPGFFNHKRQRPDLVRVEHRDAVRTYRPGDFPQAPPTRRTSYRASRALASSADRAERVQRYLAAVPPAVSGQHGDLRTFKVCCRLTRGFALSDDEALAALARVECALCAAVVRARASGQGAMCPHVWTRADWRAARRRA